MSIRTLVHETANAPGTNVTFNLAGNVAGRLSFALAFPTGAAAFYVITDGGQSEWGLGTFTAGAPNTLARTTVYGNSLGTTARLNFMGLVDVYNALPAEETIVLRDGPMAGLRNSVINGGFGLNQRGYVSGTPTTGANQYTLDRLRVVTSGQALSWADSAGVRTVTFPAGGAEQVIEAGAIVPGLNTVSWGGSATGTINGSAIANGGTLTLSGGADATVRLSGGTASWLQLEPGPRKSPVERRPHGLELLLAQRYYYRHGLHGSGGRPTLGIGIVISNALTGLVRHPVRMRAFPSFLAGGSWLRFPQMESAVLPIATESNLDFFSWWSPYTAANGEVRRLDGADADAWYSLSSEF